MADFSTWDHDTLAEFAQQCHDENIQLRHDQRMLLDAYRKLLAEQTLLDCPCGCPLLAPE